jgi:hypothetical protein
MKVKTFTGTHREAVDKHINDWLAASNVDVRKTDVAFKAYREQGWDAISGRTKSRRALGIAITVWYDELSVQSRPENWTFQPRPYKSNGRRSH